MKNKGKKGMKRVIVLLIVVIWTISAPLIADNRIIIYFKHAPEAVLQDAELEAKSTGLAEKIIKNIDTLTPGQNTQKVARNTLRSFIQPPLSGIFAHYGGYSDISNPDGLISFPLRHTVQKLYIAITPQINLFTVRDNTFSHREYIIDANNQTKLYLFQLKENEKKQWYWEVTEEKLPDDKRINNLTVVILTDPKNIYVPTGKFLASQNVQLIIPDIYLIGRSSNEEVLLRHLIDQDRYFESITTEEKKASDFAIQSMITNL